MVDGIDDLEEFPLVEAYHKREVVVKNTPRFALNNKTSKIQLVLQENIEEDWDILKIVEKHPPLGWVSVFQDSWNELKDINQDLMQDSQINGTFYPLKKNLFKVFELCPLNQVKVVILGQDPYHGTDYDKQPTAQGMSFSVRRGFRINPSLQNIYKELASSVEGFQTPNHGCLESWVKQGVFLLNMSLTVLPSQANSHKDKWISFMNRVFKAINNQNKHTIWLLWGREARSKIIKDMIGNQGTVFETSHPSPFSVRRGFSGCNHFNMANDKLIEMKETPINWSIE